MALSYKNIFSCYDDYNHVRITEIIIETRMIIPSFQRSVMGPAAESVTCVALTPFGGDTSLPTLDWSLLFRSCCCLLMASPPFIWIWSWCCWGCWNSDGNEFLLLFIETCCEVCKLVVWDGDFSDVTMCSKLQKRENNEWANAPAKNLWIYVHKRR